MNRRTFMQSLTAAFSVAMTGINFQPVKRVINYDLFTDPHTTRYSLGQPFGIDGTVYATDARVLIAHAGELEAIGEDRRLPNLSTLEWSEFEQGGFKSLWPANYQHYKNAKPRNLITACPDCMATGKIGNVRRCSCGPESEWIDYGATDGPEVRDGCEVCRTGWLGDRECKRCEFGWIETEAFRESVCGMSFCPSLMSRVRTLGNLDVKVIESRNTYGPMLLFRGENNLRGMLMGLV